MSKFFKQMNKGLQVLSLSKGFTLVETLVSISIFSMAILGLLSVLASGITNTTYAKQKITADYLAQEGIEYIRNMRDTFVLYDVTNAQTGWNNFISKLTSDPTFCQTSNGCYFDDQYLNYANPSQPMTGISINACTPNCPSLFYDSTTGKYGYAAGSPSGFIRKIQVTQISSDEMRIFSTVSWKQGSGNYNITFSEDLFNWIQ